MQSSSPTDAEVRAAMVGQMLSRLVFLVGGEGEKEERPRVKLQEHFKFFNVPQNADGYSWSKVARGTGVMGKDIRLHIGEAIFGTLISVDAGLANVDVWQRIIVDADRAFSQPVVDLAQQVRTAIKADLKRTT